MKVSPLSVRHAPAVRGLVVVRGGDARAEPDVALQVEPVGDVVEVAQDLRLLRDSAPTTPIRASAPRRTCSNRSGFRNRNARRGSGSSTRCRRRRAPASSTFTDRPSRSRRQSSWYRPEKPAPITSASNSPPARRPFGRCCRASLSLSPADRPGLRFRPSSMARRGRAGEARGRRGGRRISTIRRARRCAGRRHLRVDRRGSPLLASSERAEDIVRSPLGAASGGSCRMAAARRFAVLARAGSAVARTPS